MVYDLTDTAMNIATGAPSGTFFNSVMVFSVLVGAQLLYVLIAVLGFVVFLGLMLSSLRMAAADFWNTKILGRPSRRNIDREMVLWGVRLMAAFMVIILATALGQHTERPLRDWTHAVIRGYVFHVAMDKNDPCVRDNERIVRLSDEVVLVARNEPREFAFERRQCGLLGPS